MKNSWFTENWLHVKMESKTNRREKKGEKTFIFQNCYSRKQNNSEIRAVHDLILTLT